ARIDPAKCIGCQLCYTACWDGAHQCIHVDGFQRPEDEAAHDCQRIVATPAAVSVSHQVPPGRIPRVNEDECVGCNLCWLVCPVEGCISMVRIDKGLSSETWAERSARVPA